MYQSKKVTAVVPAHNEAPSIGLVVRELIALRTAEGPVFDRVVVCDNASTDTTAAIAKEAGALVVFEPIAGYGRACLKALRHVDSESVVVFVDGDYSVVTADIPTLLSKLAEGHALVIGSRLNADCEPGALTPQQRVGNRLATWLMRLLWDSSTSDLGPLRAVRQSTLRALGMREMTYGWTVEMQAKAIVAGLDVVEVPVHTRKRIGRSKISGTIKGTIGAGVGILSTLGKVWLTSLGAKASPATELK
ncbi:MAG: glycosyltransferase family 2 protein [Pseudomonadota bacterium]